MPGAAAAGFTYIAIPAAADLPVEEVFFPEAVTMENDLCFVRHIRALLGLDAWDPAEVRRGDLFDNKQSDLALVGDDQLELLLSLVTLKMVPLSEEDRAAGTKGMTLFHGTASDADLPLNERAMALCAACDMPLPEVRGPCAVAATETLAPCEGCREWRRCDLRLAELAALAPKDWLAATPSGNDTAASALPGGRADGYAWQQTDGELEVTFDAEPFRRVRATKRDVTVRIGDRSLLVRLRGRMLLDTRLHAAVLPSESCWTFVPGTCELQVALAKARPACWPALLAPPDGAAAPAPGRGAPSGERPAVPALPCVPPPAGAVGRAAPAGPGAAVAPRGLGDAPCEPQKKADASRARGPTRSCGQRLLVLGAAGLVLYRLAALGAQRRAPLPRRLGRTQAGPWGACGR